MYVLGIGYSATRYVEPSKDANEEGTSLSEVFQYGISLIFHHAIMRFVRASARL